MDGPVLQCVEQSVHDRANLSRRRRPSQRSGGQAANFSSGSPRAITSKGTTRSACPTVPSAYAAQPRVGRRIVRASATAFRISSPAAQLSQSPASPVSNQRVFVVQRSTSAGRPPGLPARSGQSPSRAPTQFVVRVIEQPGQLLDGGCGIRPITSSDATASAHVSVVVRQKVHAGWDKLFGDRIVSGLYGRRGSAAPSLVR